jgi:hypothetical protein
VSMHLVGPYLTTTRYSSKQKKSKSQKQSLADAKHEQWLRKRSLHPDQIKGVGFNARNTIPNYRVDNPHQLGNGVGNGFQRGIMVNLHKEKPEVQKAILDKAKRTAPAYSKGAYQYITPDQDLSDLGRKK